MLTETVRVMSGRLVREASIEVPLRGKKLDAAGIAASPELAQPVREALAAFASAIAQWRTEGSIPVYSLLS